MPAPSNLDLLVLIDALGSELFGALLHGNPCPANAHRYRRMTNPQPGDLVMETSTAYMRLRNATSEWALSRDGHIHSEAGIGILVKVTWEPYPREEGDEWDEEADGPWPTEKCWYLRRLDNGEEFRWTNANCVTILPHEGWETISGMHIKLLGGLFEDSEVV